MAFSSEEDKKRTQEQALKGLQDYIPSERRVHMHACLVYCLYVDAERIVNPCLKKEQDLTK